MEKHEMMDKIMQYQMRKISIYEMSKILDEYTNQFTIKMLEPIKVSKFKFWLLTRKWLWKKEVFDNGCVGANYHRYDHRILLYAEGMGDNGSDGNIDTVIQIIRQKYTV